MSDLSQQLPVTLVRATIHAGARATVYGCAGVGEAVLILSPFDRGAIEQLAAALAHRFRVIVTGTDAAPHEFSSWLADFFDGLGLTNAVIVTGDEQSAAVAEFAAVYPDRVRRIVTIGPSTREGRQAGLSHTTIYDALVCPAGKRDS